MTPLPQPGVIVAVGVGVAVRVGVGVAVILGVAVSVGVAVAVGVGVFPRVLGAAVREELHHRERAARDVAAQELAERRERERTRRRLLEDPDGHEQDGPRPAGELERPPGTSRGSSRPCRRHPMVRSHVRARATAGRPGGLTSVSSAAIATLCLHPSNQRPDDAGSSETTRASFARRPPR